jgi:hypothetical protein
MLSLSPLLKKKTGISRRFSSDNRLPVSVYDFLGYWNNRLFNFLGKAEALSLSKTSLTMFFFQAFLYSIVVFPVEPTYYKCNETEELRVNHSRFFSIGGIPELGFQRAAIVETKTIAALKNNSSAFAGAMFFSMPIIRIAFLSADGQKIGSFCSYVLNPLYGQKKIVCIRRMVSTVTEETILQHFDLGNDYIEGFQCSVYPDWWRFKYASWFEGGRANHMPLADGFEFEVNRLKIMSSTLHDHETSVFNSTEFLPLFTFENQQIVEQFEIMILDCIVHIVSRINQTEREILLPKLFIQEVLEQQTINFLSRLGVIDPILLKRFYTRVGYVIPPIPRTNSGGFSIADIEKHTGLVEEQIDKFTTKLMVVEKSRGPQFPFLKHRNKGRVVKRMAKQICFAIFSCTKKPLKLKNFNGFLYCTSVCFIF